MAVTIADILEYNLGYVNQSINTVLAAMSKLCAQIIGYMQDNNDTTGCQEAILYLRIGHLETKLHKK